MLNGESVMGINGLSARMLLAEHRYRPITGKLVTIGRQSIGLTGEEMDATLAECGIAKREHAYDVDTKTVGVSRERPYITQESFFAAFCDAEVISVDVSDYEQAEIVHDMQDDLPRKYRGIADFIFNGSCLDNIFDPAAAIRNMSRMLKPGGRVYHFEQGNSHPTAYLKFSADWFMDFYALNQFEDCKVYIVNSPNSLGVPMIRPNGHKPLQPSPHQIVVYSYNPYVENAGGSGYDCSSIEAFSRYEIHCIAEKGPNSTDDRRPIQKHYRVDTGHKRACETASKQFLYSPRPLFTSSERFDAASIPRIDSSDYPEQIKAVAVF